MCHWRIEVDKGKRVQLNFTRLDVHTYNDDRCSPDRVYIYDGSDTTAPLIHSICDLKFLVADIISSENTVFVYFVSDGQYRRRGFEIEYSSVEGKTCSCSTHT
ncbi:hypothetical protein NP493_1143g00048 [Ridgeia piscesae]|uniref:CUB domain-containing protein n=1 Tax=Ridgeia piscesae TaxID=27915 RepID=A0AAD9KFK4_RIDPI|nr:hypothetical protein NP493_1143g00048 [Ridgeia piscesae]